jgi:hypothetical protein
MLYLETMMTEDSIGSKFDKSQNKFYWDGNVYPNQIGYFELVIDNERNPSYIKSKIYKSDKKTLVQDSKIECVDLKKINFNEVIFVYQTFQKNKIEENLKLANLYRSKK